MASRWRLGAVFAAAVLVLVGTALVLEYGGTVDPSAASYGWGSGPGGTRPPPPHDMVFVPAGEYVIGDDASDPALDAPLRRVRLDAFYIGRMN